MLVSLKTIITLLACLLMASCANKYTVSTNVDQQKFEEYFSASNVDIFESEKKIPAKSKLIGIIDGEDCQVKAHLAPASDIIARTNARRKADKLGGNAIVFTSCSNIESKACISQVLCIGKVYQVNTQPVEP